MKKQKLELTWIGKENRPRLEPRILLEDPEKSYHAKQRITDNDLFDNRLIFGDNLLALKALEQEFTGKINCIYIDPPYNTGSAFEHYDDGLEHSLWLSLMRERLEILHRLLCDDGGSIWVQIDDNEMTYLGVLMDEVFGRQQRLNTIAVKMSEVSGVKMAHADRKLPKLKEYIFGYAKNIPPKLNVEKIAAEKWNEEYKTLLLGVERDRLSELKNSCSAGGASDSDVDRCIKILKKAKLKSLSSFFKEQGITADNQALWKYENAWRIVQAVGSSSVFRLASNNKKGIDQEVTASLSSTGLIYLHLSQFDRSAKQPRIQIIFADENLMRSPGDFWTDIKTTGGVGQEGGVLFANGKKPEALIKRILGMCTQANDIVLDSFSGSGTTGAVAHKMGRRWIMVELGEHCHTHIIPRLKKVVDGADAAGITDVVGWKGGGGFRYYRLAPSLLEKDKWGQWVISKEFNSAMLAEAACKLEGFTYAPSDTLYWQHGHSTERDFIYVTTQQLSADQLAQLSEEVGTERTLLVLCAAFRTSKSSNERYPNLTVKKIPKQVLSRCEWGHDDYSLKVENLPKAPPAPPKIDKRGQQSLFNAEEGN
jgi:adenine-specific DNA-methyltransferase